MPEWDQHFRSIKARGRDAEKLPNTIKVRVHCRTLPQHPILLSTRHADNQVDCIAVSTAPVKTAIDEQLQRLFDALVSSIRKVTPCYGMC